MKIAVCSCGASYDSFDFVEAMLHITPYSALGHQWVYLETMPFKAGRLTPASGLDWKDFIRVEYGLVKVTTR